MDAGIARAGVGRIEEDRISVYRDEEDCVEKDRFEEDRDMIEMNR